MTAMRTSMILLALGGWMAAGCFTYSPPPPPPTSMTAWSPGGGFSVNTGGTCVGRVNLTDGLATVTDACFAGPYDVVICSDNTMPNPVRCTSSLGTLTISGTGNDSVSYARLK
jgi:hypothetical protein